MADSTRKPGDSQRLTETPEFAEAVKAAVDAALPGIIAQLATARDAAGTTQEPGDPAFAKALALEIAKISGQGSGRRYVDPVVLEGREQAMARLKALLIDLHARGVVPAYRLVSKTQLPMGTLGPVVIEPLYRDRNKVTRDTEIDWRGMPNLAMQPINEAAERVMAEFRAAVGAELPPGEEDLGPLALSPTGVVMRGDAARMLMRNDPAAREASDPQLAAAAEAATIRRGDDPVKRKVRVLGTLMQPIEVS